ncbi:lysoplasmalogenase [Flagellimonas myxillae]|uniref:lysoplasmalogenase n=1 Tax=Flagellimonas myxillae TaxID=2942214 RepID=UPI00201EF2D6|nr:lysoplasmalogenase [Muricauda myxillae]MCL6267363.1 lysoplasmalogenase [Muricauda myxillae]
MGNKMVPRTINILVFFSACIAIAADFWDKEPLFKIFKPLTTILVTGLLFFGQNQKLTKFKTMVITALFFCLVGDILLLEENWFVFGLGAFLIAHLLFAYGFVVLEGFYSNWKSLLAFLGLGISILFWLKPDLGSLELPVTIYIFVIIFMAWQGTGLFLKEKKNAYALIAIAVMLFMFSDTMIAVNKFKAPFKWSGLVILSTYWLSIALIANGTFLRLKEEGTT